MPGKKFNAVSAALEEYKDVRSGSVPTQRSKARRKRYRYANVSLLGTPRWFAPTGTEVWTEKNLFHMGPYYFSNRGLPHQPVNLHGWDGAWVPDEVSRVRWSSADESDDPLADLDANEALDAFAQEQEMGFEGRGELVWDIAIKQAEEKHVEKVFKREWEVVEGSEAGDVGREVEDEFQLL